MNINDYKTFEDLSESIRQLKEHWNETGLNAGDRLSFTGIQKEMQNRYFFISNERKELLKDIDKLKDVWSNKVIAERREKLLKQFDDMVKLVIESLRQDIATLSASKLEKIGNMLCSAPTEEQLRLLSALQMRGDVDSLEVHYILPMLFENYQSMRVLQAISEQNGISLTLPVQLDCRTIYNTLNEATDYLLGACNELSKKWENMDVKYHAFFTVNEKEKNKQYDPVYQRFIDLFDSTPQLQECKAEKKHLSKGELARIDWCMRSVKGLDMNNSADYILIAKCVADVLKEHPDMKNLFELSEYRDMIPETDNLNIEEQKE